MLQNRQAPIAGHIENVGAGQILRGKQWGVGDRLRVDARGEPLVDDLLSDRITLEYEVLPEKRRKLCPGGSFAEVIAKEVLQTFGRRLARRVNSAWTEQHEAVDALRPLERHSQRASSPERIAQQVGSFDLESVQDAEHGAGKIAERIGAIDPLCRSAVARQVGNDYPK